MFFCGNKFSALVLCFIINEILDNISFIQLGVLLIDVSLMSWVSAVSSCRACLSDHDGSRDFMASDHTVTTDADTNIYFALPNFGELVVHKNVLSGLLLSQPHYVSYIKYGQYSSIKYKT